MTGIDGYGVPARNDIAANAMMFPEMSLPPRCRPFLTKRRQRGGSHYASSEDLYPASIVIPQHYPLQRTRRRRSAQGNACPDSGKTRHRKPFLGVWQRSTEKRELLIAFSGIYAIFIKGTSWCFLRVKGIFSPSWGRHLCHSRFSS